MTYRAYTGIGSRSAPPEILQSMLKIGHYLGERGWTLRSGGAPGSDVAFESGALFSKTRPEIYLPWAGFNNHDGTNAIVGATKSALAIASQHHPAWVSLSDAAKKLHARNVHQVLGADCETPARFVVCWTPDGADGVEVRTSSRTGGTGQAIRIAAWAGVPVVNLACDGWRERLKTLIASL